MDCNKLISTGPASRFGLPKPIEILITHLLLNIKKTILKKLFKINITL